MGRRLRPRKAKRPRFEIRLETVDAPDARQRLRRALDLVLRAAARAREAREREREGHAG
jgi:hypothetical protein